MEAINVINMYPEEESFRELMLDYLEEYKSSYQRSLKGMVNISDEKEHHRLKTMEKDLLIFAVEMQAFLIRANNLIPSYDFYLNDFVRNVIFKEKDNLACLIRKSNITESLYEEYGKKMFIHLKILNIWFKNNTLLSINEEII